MASDRGGDNYSKEIFNCNSNAGDDRSIVLVEMLCMGDNAILQGGRRKGLIALVLLPHLENSLRGDAALKISILLH